MNIVDKDPLGDEEIQDLREPLSVVVHLDLTRRFTFLKGIYPFQVPEPLHRQVPLELDVEGISKAHFPLEVLRCPKGPNGSVCNKGHLFTKGLGLPHVVGGHQDGGAFFLVETSNGFPYSAGHIGVQPHGGLV